MAGTHLAAPGILTPSWRRRLRAVCPMIPPPSGMP